MAHDPPDCALLTQEVTEIRVLALSLNRGASAVPRYLVAQLHAMNFVTEDALGGGVYTTLCIAAHGKDVFLPAARDGGWH